MSKKIVVTIEVNDSNVVERASVTVATMGNGFGNTTGTEWSNPDFRAPRNPRSPFRPMETDLGVWLDRTLTGFGVPGILPHPPPPPPPSPPPNPPAWAISGIWPTPPPLDKGSGNVLLKLTNVQAHELYNYFSSFSLPVVPSEEEI